jgi:hypothetical protein
MAGAFEYTWRQTAINQSIALPDERPITATVREIEVFDSGNVYGVIMRCNEKYVVQLIRSGIWRLMGTEKSIKAI